MPFIRVTNSDAGKPPQCAPEILEAMWPDLPCGVIGNVTACHETKIARDHWPANLLTTLPKKKKADIHELFLEVQPPSSLLWRSSSACSKGDLIAELLRRFGITMRAQLRFPPFMLYTMALDAPQRRDYLKAKQQQERRRLVHIFQKVKFVNAEKPPYSSSIITLGNPPPEYAQRTDYQRTLPVGCRHC